MILIQMTTSTMLVTVINNIAVADTAVDIIITVSVRNVKNLNIHK